MDTKQRDALENYVHAALALQGFSFDAPETAEIVLQFSRIEAIAQVVLGAELPFDLDPAAVFQP